ncbi:amino acid ABC transporter permease [Gordonia sp. DT219]|uniref:amino acid ABC transporter permease n=1 Tax=Gordonia sp. DT219 TaxID=3416658 RepID=UPI003CE99B39
MSNFFNVLIDALPTLLSGMKVTVYVTVISLVIASILGLCLCFMTLAKSAIVRGIARVYVNIFRGTPLLVQILFIYFGIPSLLGIHMEAIYAGILAMSLYVTAYMSEIFRAGIQGVDAGQFEASVSIGLKRLQMMRLVILPQAVRSVLPAFVNQFSMTIKDTSLLSVIGIAELTFQGQEIYAANFETFTILFELAVLYFIIVYVLTFISRILERRMARS